MDQIEIANQRKIVISTRNDSTSPWHSRLYINGPEKTATLTCAKHKTRAGVEKWARRVLER